MQNVVGLALVAMATKFGLGAVIQSLTGLSSCLLPWSAFQLSLRWCCRQHIQHWESADRWGETGLYTDQGLRDDDHHWAFDQHTSWCLQLTGFYCWLITDISCRSQTHAIIVTLFYYYLAVKCLFNCCTYLCCIMDNIKLVHPPWWVIAFST